MRTVARGGALAVVGVVTAIVAARSVRPGEKCVNLGICRTCGVFDGCHLPQALSTRAALGKR